MLMEVFVYLAGVGGMLKCDADVRTPFTYYLCVGAVLKVY